MFYVYSCKSNQTHATIDANYSRASNGSNNYCASVAGRGYRKILDLINQITNNYQRRLSSLDNINGYLLSYLLTNNNKH